MLRWHRDAHSVRKHSTCGSSAHDDYAYLDERATSPDAAARGTRRMTRAAIVMAQVALGLAARHAERCCVLRWILTCDVSGGMLVRKERAFSSTEI